jgi:hypothetical protein
MNSWGIYELYRQQAEELQVEREARGEVTQSVQPHMGTWLHGVASRTGKNESRAGKIDGRWFRRLRLLRDV